MREVCGARRAHARGARATHTLQGMEVGRSIAYLMLAAKDRKSGGGGACVGVHALARPSFSCARRASPILRTKKKVGARTSSETSMAVGVRVGRYVGGAPAPWCWGAGEGGGGGGALSG